MNASETTGGQKAPETAMQGESELSEGLERIEPRRTDMDDAAITAIVGWPTEPEMATYRAVAQAAMLAEREAWGKPVAFQNGGTTYSLDDCGGVIHPSHIPLHKRSNVAREAHERSAAK